MVLLSGELLPLQPRYRRSGCDLIDYNSYHMIVELCSGGRLSPVFIRLRGIDWNEPRSPLRRVCLCEVHWICDNRLFRYSELTLGEVSDGLQCENTIPQP